MSRSPKLDRTSWLDAGLDALYEEGIEAVRVEPLARRLGVTKGSFYHHLGSRAELLSAMVDRWQGIQEGLLQVLAAEIDADPHAQLSRVVEFIHRKDSRHDVAMRSWALSNDYARRALQSVDRQRLEFLEGVFERMGFETDEAKLRARLIYFYQVGEYSLSVRDRESLRGRLKRLRFDLLTRRPVDAG